MMPRSFGERHDPRQRRPGVVRFPRCQRERVPPGLEFTPYSAICQRCQWEVTELVFDQLDIGEIRAASRRGTPRMLERPLVHDGGVLVLRSVQLLRKVGFPLQYAPLHLNQMTAPFGDPFWQQITSNRVVLGDLIRNFFGSSHV
jgi:hypothetical protein